MFISCNYAITEKDLGKCKYISFENLVIRCLVMYRIETLKRISITLFYSILKKNQRL